MASPSPSPSPPVPTTDSDTTALYMNLAVGVPTICICLVVFDFFRRKVPSVFESRRVLNGARHPLDYHGKRVYSPPPPSNHWLGWVRPVLHLELDTVAQTHGLDTALFLRFMRSMMMLFAALSILCCGALMPVYYTGSNRHLPEGDPARTLGVQRLSLSNVSSDDSWRFWYTLVFEFLVASAVCYVLYNDFEVYGAQRRRYRSADNPANFAVLVQDIPLESATEQGVFDYWDRMFPGEIARVHHVRNDTKLAKKIARFWTAVTKRERAEWDLAFNDKLEGARPTHKNGMCSCFKGADTAVDSIEYWTERQEHYAGKVGLYQREIGSQHCSPTRAAIVVFTSRRAASIAAQTNFARVENEWRVSCAPEPNAINWGSLGIPGKQVALREGITLVAGIVLTLFWIVPVVFITGLASLSSLANLELGGNKPFAFAANVAEASPVIVGFIEGLLPPIILSVFLSLIPTFFRLFVSVSRVTSTARVDRMVRDYFFNFLIFSNFLYVTFGGALLDQIAVIVDRPRMIVEILASKIPAMGGFMMNFILLKALSESPTEILQIGRVVVRWFMLHFMARTPREKRNHETGNTIFLFYRFYAVAQLVALLGVVYSTIAPLVVLCALAYFVVAYVVLKYNLCFSMHNPYEDGGRMYGGALYGVWIGLFLHMLTMVGLFGANKEPAQTIIILIPTVGVVLFILWCRRRFQRLAEYGSVLETQNRVDEVADGVDKIPDALALHFVHPAFLPLPDPVENLNGVDGNDGKPHYESEASDEETALSRDDGALLSQPTYGSTEEWKDAHASSGALTRSGILNEAVA